MKGQALRGKGPEPKPSCTKAASAGKGPVFWAAWVMGGRRAVGSVTPARGQIYARNSAHGIEADGLGAKLGGSKKPGLSARPLSA